MRPYFAPLPPASSHVNMGSAKFGPSAADVGGRIRPIGRPEESDRSDVCPKWARQALSTLDDARFFRRRCSPQSRCSRSRPHRRGGWKAGTKIGGAARFPNLGRLRPTPVPESGKIGPISTDAGLTFHQCPPSSAGIDQIRLHMPGADHIDQIRPALARTRNWPKWA